MSYKVIKISDIASNARGDFDYADLQTLLNAEKREGWELAQICQTYIVFNKARSDEAIHLRENIQVAVEALQRIADSNNFDERNNGIELALKWLRRQPDPDAENFPYPPTGRNKAPWVDKSGDDIYEGDTVRWDTGTKGEVVHNEADGWRVRMEGDSVNPTGSYVSLQAAHNHLLVVVA